MSATPHVQLADPRLVVGLAARTTNAAESDLATASIPGLWTRFTSERWPARLEQFGAFGPILSVYSAYESDVSGGYQVLVGRQVHTPITLSPPLQSVTTPAGQYLAFRCPGPLPRAVVDGWSDVWQYFARPNAPPRAYVADYEQYFDDAPVEIWVGVAER